MEEYKCKRCDKEFDNYTSLRIHTARTHKIKSPDFYVEFYLDGKKPTCKCGCGEYVKWNNNKYRDYLQGHIARVHNNWGHNKSAIMKSAETRREQFKNGEREVWNVGLTKETDDRVKQNGVKVSTAFTDERKIEYSDRMRKNRLDGTILTLYGKNHSQWKGGSSSISCMIRSDKRLYTNWIFPILKRDGFKCTKCESTTSLEVHHNNINFAEIISNYLDKNKEYTFHQKKDIVDQIIEYHTLVNVSGVTLCKQCHMEEHPSYNF